ncbi:hypothetical protein [Roseateles sp. LYH14W]|uniref:Tat pathway signal sequence domain protein n=1 Tax=Pelomonas parva TaxID=3299032 RepID=A0ABW7F5D3_9BURK
MSEHTSRAPQQMPEAQPAAVASGVSKARRNLLRASMIGGPTLIALKPASVIACSCKLPSGFTVSGNASRGPKNCADPSEVASVWKPRTTKTANGKDAYGNTIYEHRYRTKNGQVLTIHSGKLLSDLGITRGSYSGTTVGAWMNTGDTSDTGLFMACYVTAWAHSNGSNFPTKNTLRDMWNAAVATTAGYTVPNQTQKWDKAQVIGYLRFLTSQAPA